MKKWTTASLLALTCGSSVAQSGVTIYGLVDVYVTRFSGAPGGVNASNTAITRVESGGMTTSNWGIRGLEDLGSGFTATFELSSFLRVDSGSAGRSDAVGAVAADPLFSREASVSLVSERWGRLRVGNFSTPMFSQSLGSNAFLSSTAFSPINIVTFIGSPLTGGTGWANQVAYDSPTLGNFSAGVSYAASEGQGGPNAGARVAFSSGPWTVSLAGQSVKRNPITFADGTSPNDTKAWQLAASYDFKVVKLFAHLGRIQNDGTSASPADVRYSIWDISASVPVGDGNILMAYANRKTTDPVAPAPDTAFGGNVERRVLSLAYDHFLSKRTDIYAVVMFDKTRSSTLPAPGQVLDADATNVGLGIRHRF